MYELLDHNKGNILYIDGIPQIWSKMQIKFRQVALTIIIPIKEVCSDNIFSALCNVVYAVTVPDSLWKASECPRLLL